MSRFTKLGADGAPLAEGGEHVATLDTTTGLTWSVKQVSDPDGDGEITFEAAETECSKLELAGKADWRMPTREELQTILDLSKYRPAIDGDAFPGTASDWYWTSTPCAWSSDRAWIVYFDGGVVSGNNRGSGAFVRAVRGGVPAGQ